MVELQRVTLNKDGFGIVEVMISMVVLLVVFLGLMQGALVAIDSNMQNVLRQEAVHIANERMSEAKNISFATLTSDPADVVYNRNVRSIAGFTYTTRRTVAALDAANLQVNINVAWNWKGQPCTFNARTLVRNPS